MSLQSYIVLRRKPVLAPAAAAMRRPRGFAPTAVAEPEAVELTVADLTPKETAELRRDPNARAVARPMPMKLVAPVDEQAASAAAGTTEWGVKAVGATTSPFDGAGVKVAVLDTGIDPNHPAFAGVTLERMNFTAEADDDQHGHGTHCAGTIFGRDVGGRRIGVARGVTHALIGKVLGNGGGSSADIAKAIQWAIHGGANVISMSLGIDFPGYVRYLHETQGLPIEAATSIALEAYRANVNLFSELADFVRAMGPFGQGAVIVAASGNESNRPQYQIAVAPPAAATGILAIGALGEAGSKLQVAFFSNDQVNVAAPGVNVVSAFPGGGFKSMSGTSMATPHAAGVAALWAQKIVGQTGGVLDGQVLIANLVASGITEPLAAGYEPDDVGTGIVRAPQS
jgi:subtilisin family serine protease